MGGAIERAEPCGGGAKGGRGGARERVGTFCWRAPLLKEGYRHLLWHGRSCWMKRRKKDLGRREGAWGKGRVYSRKAKSQV